jgi:hypothetical protein
MGLHRPWALDGRFQHDGDCFELNPVTWYVLAHYGVTVRGPSVDRLGIYVDVDARVRFCVDNLIGYWRPLAGDVRAGCKAMPDGEFAPDSFEWCALGALRLHHTAFQGGVVSKAGAAEYGLDVAPAEFHAVLRDAQAVRAGTSATTSFGAVPMRLAADLIDWCVDEAEAALPRG